MLLQLKFHTYKLTCCITDFGVKYQKYLSFGKEMHPVVNDLKPSQKQQKMLDIGLMKHRLL